MVTEREALGGIVDAILGEIPENPDRPILDRDMLRRFLTTDIPFRLQAVDGLAWYCGRASLGAWFEGVELRIHGASIPPHAFTNSVVEMGLASVRALSEFLGFKVQRWEDRLIPALPRRRDRQQIDAGVEDFGCEVVAPEVAPFSAVRGATPEATLDALVYALRAANAGVAHLTYGPVGADAARLELACDTLWRLTTERLYRGRTTLSEFRFPTRVAEVFAGSTQSSRM